MKERPILFSSAMVRAILSGAKTQTRRVVKPQPVWQMNRDGQGGPYWVYFHGKSQRAWREGGDQSLVTSACPYGGPGDRLWVRETWAGDQDYGVVYRADHPDADLHAGELDDGEQSIRRWRPSIYMPRWASRIDLEITDVRVERLQDISEADAEAEGIRRIESRIPGITHGLEGLAWTSARKGFQALWDDINLEPNTPISQQTKSWEASPWVWAITFKVVPQ